MTFGQNRGYCLLPMKFQAYSFLLFIFLLTGFCTIAQQLTVRGKVIESGTQLPVEDCEVYIQGSRQIAKTDSTGLFTLSRVKPGRHKLHFASIRHEPFHTEIEVGQTTAVLDFTLSPKEHTLQEVEIRNAAQNRFGQTHLREVEGTAIYASKKSDVILIDSLVANLATNNARQVYARVAGLNIWENDQGGLQLSIGGRGLDPNRTSNFNVRQNGYDISADALGYPESYYTPPIEAIKRIQLVRGAASLQYGTQFGGLLNFVLRSPTPDKTIEVVSRQTVGSFGFFNSFNSLSGTIRKFSYYGFAQFKKGDGWRPNSAFENKTAYADLRYQVSENLKTGVQLTHMDYLAQQPGGLSDDMFLKDARQSNRQRNWFKVDWNLFNINAEWQLNQQSTINLTAFGLIASRYSVGFRPNRVDTQDNEIYGRDLITGDFRNYGLEARYLKRYLLGSKNGVLLVGSRYYNGYNHSKQGFGTAGSEADFHFAEPSALSTSNYSDYEFPNLNGAAFAENILYLSDKFSITPGLRYEYIRTRADGFYGVVNRDLAGNIIQTTRQEETRVNTRDFLLAGLGMSYKPREQLEVYGNMSQNYRSITFSDMRIANPSAVIDPNLRDERGYSADLGLRGTQGQWLIYDLSLFALQYGNRIGEVQIYDQNDRVLRQRSNIGKALITGVESYAELDLLQLLRLKANSWDVAAFGNAAFIKSEYIESELAGIKGKEVEFVPALNLKSGVRAGYRALKASFQVTYLSDQFSDATNAEKGGVSAVIGKIPAYSVLDASLSWERKWLRIEGSVNNVLNAIYFTRRATGYPGPGILPSDGRSLYITFAVKW
jgi:Fe(3+) dicitrate transport protein